MIKLQNKDILAILMELQQFDPQTNQVKGGILTEEMSLGVRRRLQKIRKALLDKNEELGKDIEEINKVEEKEQKEKEFEVLANEEFTLDLEPVSLEMLENLITKENYNMIILEKITK